jgi:hypothetical protein
MDVRIKGGGKMKLLVLGKGKEAIIYINICNITRLDSLHASLGFPDLYLRNNYNN